MKTRLFVTGSSGFIGANLVERLLNLGYEVSTITRNGENPGGLEHPHLHVYQGDILDIESLVEPMKGCEGVFHLAAYAKVWSRDPRTFYDVNVEGTVNVLDVALSMNVKRVVVTSTAAVLGPCNEGPVSEDIIRKVPFFNNYETSKFMMEERVQHYVRMGLEVMVVLPPRVYGPGLLSESNALTKMIRWYRDGKWRVIPGDGKDIGSYVYVDDVVNGHILAYEKGRSGERYIIGGENADFFQFFDTLARVTGKKFRMFKLPLWAMMIFAWIQDMLARWFGRRPLITRDWAGKYMHRWEMSCDKAIRELGYTITPLEEGIRKTLEWIDHQNRDPYHALITGASSGIGKALAYKYAEEGRNLALIALPGTGLGEVAHDIDEHYDVDVKWLGIDLTQEGAADDVFDWCYRKGIKINRLINNAGFGNLEEFERSDMRKNMSMMQLNMYAIVSLTRKFLPELKLHQPARILNVGSMLSLFPAPFKSLYCATKSFVLTFSRSLREELNGSGVEVSCLCPGGVLTNRNVTERIHNGGKLHEMFTITADRLAEITYRTFESGKAVIIPSWHNQLILWVGRVVPSAYHSQVARRVYRNQLRAMNKSEVRVNTVSWSG